MTLNRPYEGAPAPAGNPLEPAPPRYAELRVPDVTDPTRFADLIAWVREWALDPRHEHTLAATPLSELDDGIARTVLILAANGVETFESCQGGDGHAFHEPTVRFYGNKAAGFHALSVAHNFDLRPTNLRRYWYLLDQEPVGPNWEMTFA